MGVLHATPLMILFIALLVLLVFHYIREVRSGKELYVRHIAGVDAVNEAIGRSAELGRPMIFTTGLLGINAILYACLGVMYHVARKAAVYKSKLFIPSYQPDVMVVAEDVVRDAYRSEGKLNDFDPDTIKYLSDEQFAYASGYMGLAHRENVGSAFLFGYFAAESLILAEAGQQIGAMQVAASYTPEQVPFFITAADYTLIGEEMFAAAAYLTREPVQVGSLYAQDRMKLCFFVLIVLGVIFATLHAIAPEATILNLKALIYADWSSESWGEIWRWK